MSASVQALHPQNSGTRLANAAAEQRLQEILAGQHRPTTLSAYVSAQAANAHDPAKQPWVQLSVNWPRIRTACVSQFNRGAKGAANVARATPVAAAKIVNNVFKFLYAFLARLARIFGPSRAGEAPDQSARQEPHVAPAASAARQDGMSTTDLPKPIVPKQFADQIKEQLDTILTHIVPAEDRLLPAYGSDLPEAILESIVVSQLHDAMSEYRTLDVLSEQIDQALLSRVAHSDLAAHGIDGLKGFQDLSRRTDPVSRRFVRDIDPNGEILALLSEQGRLNEKAHAVLSAALFNVDRATEFGIPRERLDEAINRSNGQSQHDIDSAQSLEAFVSEVFGERKTFDGDAQISLDELDGASAAGTVVADVVAGSVTGSEAYSDADADADSEHNAKAVMSAFARFKE